MFLAATMHFFQRQRIFRELPRVTFSPHGLFRTAAPRRRLAAELAEKLRLEEEARLAEAREKVGGRDTFGSLGKPPFFEVV